MQPSSMNPSLSPLSRTYHSIDLLKVVAALLVVAIHAFPAHDGGQPLPINLFSRMAVPVFFVVSAFFFFKKKPGREQLLRYLKRMGALYAFWLVVEAYITIDGAFLSHPEWPLGKALAIFARNFLLNSTFSGSWFIMALIIGIPLVYWLCKRLNTWAVLTIGIGCYIPIVATTNYYAYLPEGAQHATDAALKALGYYHNSAFAALAFCAMGRLIAEHEAAIARLKGWTTTVALALCVALAWMEVAYHEARFADCYFMLVPTTAAIVVWVLKHETAMNLPYALLRNFSTVTYFSHFIFIWALASTPLSPLAIYFVVVALSLATTFAFRILSPRIPLLRYGY